MNDQVDFKNLFEEIMKIELLGKRKLWYRVSKIKMQFLEFKKVGKFWAK